MRALIADADLTDGGVVTDSLEQLGFAVAQCASASRALRKELAAEYDLIVVDITVRGAGYALRRVSPSVESFRRRDAAERPRLGLQALRHELRRR